LRVSFPKKVGDRMKEHYNEYKKYKKYCDDPVKVHVRQSKDGKKKKIRIENDTMKIKIRVKDRDCD